jgi:hypothetical protein
MEAVYVTIAAIHIYPESIPNLEIGSEIEDDKQFYTLTTGY